MQRKCSLFICPGREVRFSKQKCLFETEEIKEGVRSISGAEKRKKIRKFNGKVPEFWKVGLRAIC